MTSYLDTRLGSLPRTGTFVQSLGSFNTLAELNATHPANNYNPGTTAYTVDQGFMISDGSVWESPGMVPGEEDVTAATYAAARLLSGAATGARLQVRGRTTQSDGGQGLFTWVAGGSTTIDDGFELAAPGGIWRRADTSFVTYEMFGAVPMTSLADVSHDSTAAINACHLALPPPSATTKRAFRVMLQGLYGISSTVNFLTLTGIEFFSSANFSALGCGYVWIAALSNTTHALFLKQCRYVKLRRLRVCANSETASAANGLLSAICLSSDYTTSIQERCTFEDIIIGNRDSYDSLGSNFQFVNGINTETISGTHGNNDFHLFKSIRQQSIGVGFNNQDSQSVGWIIKDCKVGLPCNTFAQIRRVKVICRDIEADQCLGSVFILNGTSGTDAPNLLVHGFTSQTNQAELATITGLSTFVIEDAGIDCNRDIGGHPYLIVAADNDGKQITIKNASFIAAPVIDFGTGSRLKHLTVKGGKPTTVTIRNTGTGMGQDQRVFYRWEPGGHGSQWNLANTDWAPVDALIYPPYAVAADPLVTELPLPTVRLGRRNTSACVDVKNIATTATNISAGAIYTFINALPVGLILGVSLHISTLPPGPASINIGDGTTAARWGNKTNVSGSGSNPPEASLIAAFTDAGPVYNKAVGNVVLTAVGGTGSFSGGTSSVVLTVHYIDFAQRFYNPNGSA